MTIYEPVPIFSAEEKLLLKLLARLLLEILGCSVAKSNLKDETVPLTDREAVELVTLLEQVASSKEFLEASTFVEGIANPRRPEVEYLREIYLSSRKRRGRSRAMSSYHWDKFQYRLGIIKDPVRGAAEDVMTFDYFTRMERRLLRSTTVNGLVVDSVMKIALSQEIAIEEIRSGERGLAHGSVRHVLTDILDSLKNTATREIPSRKIGAGILLISDLGALFTTRDWSVAGTISVMACALADLSSKSK